MSIPEDVPMNFKGGCEKRIPHQRPFGCLLSTVTFRNFYLFKVWYFFLFFYHILFLTVTSLQLFYSSSPHAVFNDISAFTVPIRFTVVQLNASPVKRGLSLFIFPCRLKMIYLELKMMIVRKLVIFDVLFSFSC